MCAAVGATWLACGGWVWVLVCCAHRWTNNGSVGGTRLLRWDGSSIATERGEGKIRGQFFGGRVLKVEEEKAADGYVPPSERAGQAGRVAKQEEDGGAEEGAAEGAAAVTGPAVPVLTDAIGACRILRPCGQGGHRARAAAAERLGAPPSRYGRFDGA
jgi:hypothetical protein